MIFADKLILLRKKNGLSQEALAEKLDVTRQAVSRWEGAQTFPDISKVILISKTFGVSIDYLLKDEIEEEKEILETVKEKPCEIRKVNKDEIVLYLKDFKNIALYYAAFIALLFLGLIIGFLVYFAVSIKTDYSKLIESTISGVLVCALIWVAALVTFIVASEKSRKSKKILKGFFEFEIDAQEYLFKQRQKYVKTFFAITISAICLGTAAILLMISGIIFAEVHNDKYYVFAFLLPSVLLLMSALALIEVRVTLKRAFNRLMLKGNYDENSLKKKRAIILSILYWAVVAVVFVAGKSVTKEWYFSCVFLAFTVLIYFSVLIVTAIYRNNSRRNKNDSEV